MLTGVLRLPDGNSATALVTVHGWGANRIGPNNMLADLCSAAADAGFMAFDFDLSGRGDSEGDPSNVTVDDMMADTVAAIDYVRAKGAKRVVLFGLCSGGNAALGAVALKGRAEAVIAVSTLPFMRIDELGSNMKKTGSHARGYLAKLFRAETWKKLFRGAISFRGVYRTMFGHMSKKEVSSDRLLKDTNHNVLGLLKSYCGTIVHIYGGADPESLAARGHFEKQYAQMGHSAKFVVIDKANHNFYGLKWRDQITAVALEQLRIIKDTQ